MEDKKEFSRAYLTMKKKLAKLGFEIEVSRLEKSEKEKILQPFRDVSFLTGVTLGTVIRHQEIADKLTLKINGTIDIIEKRMDTVVMEKETNLLLQTELLVLNEVLAELKKIGFE